MDAVLELGAGVLLGLTLAVLTWAGSGRLGLGARLRDVFRWRMDPTIAATIRVAALLDERPSVRVGTAHAVIAVVDGVPYRVARTPQGVRVTSMGGDGPVTRLVYGGPELLAILNVAERVLLDARALSVPS